MRRAGSGGFRQPWVPQHGVPKRPGYPNLASCSPTWAPGTSTWALQTGLGSQEPPWGPSGSVFEHVRRAPGGLKPRKIQQKPRVLRGFVLVGVSARDPPKQAQQTSKKRPPGGPGAAQEAPGPAKEAPRRPQETPGAPQERPKSRPSSASERPWRPNGAHLAHKSPPKGSRKPFWNTPRCDFPPSGVHFRMVFHPPESMFKTVLWAKPTQAYGQHRSTLIYNFCMWISTATDSRSIDR